MSEPVPARVRTSTRPARIGWKPGSYDRTVASSRLRTFLPCEHLRRAGWDASVVPPDGAGRYDCVVFQKAYDEGDIALAERLGAGGVKTVFDLCDDHFYNPNDHPKLAQRAERLARMLGVVDAVTASTPTLARLVRGTPTFVVDDALEVPSRGAVAALWQTGARVRRRLGPRRARLVWFGNSGSTDPPFGMVHLAGLVPVLERLNRSLPLQLTVMSNSRRLFARYVREAGFPARYLSWSPARFANRFPTHDVCVVPVEANPFTLGKTSNRVVLSLMLGVPVVADVIPSYEELSPWVLFGDWEEHITAYAVDPELRRRHVEGARDYITRTYTPERVVEQWGRVFDALLGRSER